MYKRCLPAALIGLVEAAGSKRKGKKGNEKGGKERRRKEMEGKGKERRKELKEK